jgi:hypothetical protein
MPLPEYPASCIGKPLTSEPSLLLSFHAGAEGIEPPFRWCWRPAAEPVWLAPKEGSSTNAGGTGNLAPAPIT